MSTFKLLWAIFGNDHTLENSQRGQIDEATQDDALKCLEELMGRSGLMELVVSSPAETGPRGLQIRTEEGRSIITLAEVDEKKEKKIRAYRLGEEGEPVELHGNRWHAQMVCRDTDAIRTIISELYTTHNVSTQQLS